MAISEFRFNKKRKHYAYIFKEKGEYRKNILFTTKATRKWHSKEKKNKKLFRHPNPKSTKTIYVIPIIYIDSIDSFHSDSLKWHFHKNDKRIIKRIKKRKNRSRTHIN